MPVKPLPAIPALLHKLLWQSNESLVQTTLACLQANDTAAAIQCIQQANHPTRQLAWELLARQHDLPARALPDVILAVGHDQRPALQRWLLNLCLERGWAPEAMHLVRHGAPVDAPSLSMQDDQRNAGPLARLMYDEYPGLPATDRAPLAAAMMEQGDITHFNPGLIARHDTLLAFLDRAPDPSDKQAWAGFIWGLDEVFPSQVRFNTDPRNAPELLARGYPGIPIDLVVRALIAGNQDHALALLHWVGDALPTKHCQGLISAFDTITEEPVLAPGFWHALSDAWATGVLACRTNGWPESDIKDPWPNEEALDLLLQFPELDLLGLDDEGLTPMERAIAICGQAGPVAELQSKHDARKLRQTTPQATQSGQQRRRF